jgi:hypothetical protein
MAESPEPEQVAWHASPIVPGMTHPHPGPPHPPPWQLTTTELPVSAAPLGHWFPHSPQLLLSVCSSTHWLPQSV